MIERLIFLVRKLGPKDRIMLKVKDVKKIISLVNQVEILCVAHETGLLELKGYDSLKKALANVKKPEVISSRPPSEKHKP